MTSPARRHREETLARLANQQAAAIPGAASPRPTDGPAASEYELLLAKLGADLARLRDIQSVEAKIALKRELADGYAAHVDATLAAAAGAGAALQDEIVARMLIWRIDIGDWDKALEIGAHVLSFHLAMPSSIVRTPACLIAEEVAEAALKADSTGAAFPLDVLSRTIDLTAHADMPDQVRAKLYKAQGRHLVRMAETIEAGDNAPAGGMAAAREAALIAFRRAFALNAKCGVIKDIEQLDRKVAAARAGAPAPGGGEGSGTGA